MGTALQSWADLHDPGTTLPAPPVRRASQGRQHLPDRAVRRRDLRGRRVQGRPGHGPRRQRARAPRAHRPRVRGAVPLARPVVARPDLRDGRPRGLHVLLGPDRGRHRLAARRADRALVHRVHRHRRPSRRRPSGSPRSPPIPAGRRRTGCCSGTRTGARSRSRSASSGRSTTRASWSRSGASPATSASASASSSSCGRPRSATGSSSTTRPTSCSRPTRRPASSISRTRSSG